MSLRNGDALNGAVGIAEGGQDVEVGTVNTWLIARNPAQLQELVAALAGLFPLTFVVDSWEPYRPLKVGIHKDLVERGVLLLRECKALRWYVSRRMYQVALAAGGLRYDLDGNVAGEVTPEQLAGAKAMLARIDAKRAARAKAVADEERAARQATKAPISTNAPNEMPATAAPSVKPARLSLADLKEAARARREAAHD
jgi:sRNA-binding protein